MSADADALTALLAAQQLSLACEERVLAGPALHGAAESSRALLATIRDAERLHVQTTRDELRRLGGTAPAPPADDAAIDRALEHHHLPGRPASLRGPRDAYTLLVGVERAAIGAAYVALSRLQDGSLSALVAAMMASDAQHESLLAQQAHPGDVAGAIPYGVVEGIS